MIFIEDVKKITCLLTWTGSRLQDCGSAFPSRGWWPGVRGFSSPGPGWEEHRNLGDKIRSSSLAFDHCYHSL